MTISLVLTNDWELFGDGSGDYYDIQHVRLKNLLDMVESHDGKLTIFAELGQQWAHEAWGLHDSELASIADDWRLALRDSVRRGHDVQLHIHAQWLSATREAGRWRLGDSVFLGHKGEAEVAAALSRGKKDLEKLLRQECPQYRCLAFRAGAFCFDPWENFFKAYRAWGFDVDSSVQKGLHLPGFMDFRAAPQAVVPWRPGRMDALAVDPGGALLEFPVAAVRSRIPGALHRVLGAVLGWRLALGGKVTNEDLLWVERRVQEQERRYPSSRRIAVTGRSAAGGSALSAKIRRLMAREWVALDYDLLPPDVFVKALNQVVRHWKRLGRADASLPVVALGHCKVAHDWANLDRTLTLAKKILGGEIRLVTLTQAVLDWSQNDRNNPA